MVLLTFVTTSNPHTLYFDHPIEKPSYIRLLSEVKKFNTLSANNPEFTITAKAHTPTGSMIINSGNTTFSHGLLQLLGIQKLSPITFVKRLTAPSTYFVHCDMIDKRQNLLNGKPSTVLARFDIRGQPFEKVHYQTPQQYVLRDTDSGYYVNSITLSVKDKNGNLFDFNDQPLEFEVEIN